MNRRHFLGSILALGAAPAIVRADSLMRIVPRETTVLTGINPVTYAWYSGEEPPAIWTSETDNFYEVVEEIIRARSDEIARNVIANNRLLMQLRRER